MSRVERFLEYARAFDRAVESQDWKEVGSFFTPDAVFESLADPPMDGLARGRDAILQHFATTVSTFDRRFDHRSLRFLEGPAERDGIVRARFEASYRVAGAPPLVFTGSTEAHFQGDHIALLRDIIASKEIENLLRWVQDNAPRLASTPPLERVDKGPAIALAPGEGRELAQPGGGYASVKLSGESFPVNSFSLGTHTLPPGAHIPERCLSRGEVVYFVHRGRGELELDGAHHPLTPGTTVVAGRGARHRVHNAFDEELELVWLSFPPGIERLLARGTGEDWFEGPPQLPGCEGASLPKGPSRVVPPEAAASYWQPTPNDGYVDILVSPYNHASTQFALGTQWMAPRSLLPDHVHGRNEEVLYVLEGNAKALVDGQALDVHPGSLLFAGRWVRHGFLNDTDEPFKILWVFLPPDLETLLSAVGRPRRAGEPRPKPFGMPPNLVELLDRAGFGGLS